MSPIVDIALRVFLGGTFLYAGIVKVPPSAEFAFALAPFTVIPEGSISLIATILPVIEIGAGVAILIPWTRRPAAAFLLILCLAFISLLTWALANGIIVSCGCFGRDSSPSAAKMLLAIGRDVVLAAAACALLLWPSQNGNPRSSGRHQAA